MMNGISRMSHKRVSIASRVMLGVDCDDDRAY
jgi:hypothetical protein